MKMLGKSIQKLIIGKIKLPINIGRILIVLKHHRSRRKNITGEDHVVEKILAMAIPKAGLVVL